MITVPQTFSGNGDDDATGQFGRARYRTGRFAPHANVKRMQAVDQTLMPVHVQFRDQREDPLHMAGDLVQLLLAGDDVIETWIVLHALVEEDCITRLRAGLSKGTRPMPQESRRAG